METKRQKSHSSTKRNKPNKKTIQTEHPDEAHGMLHSPRPWRKKKKQRRKNESKLDIKATKAYQMRIDLQKTSVWEPGTRRKVEHLRPKSPLKKEKTERARPPSSGSVDGIAGQNGFMGVQYGISTSDRLAVTAQAYNVELDPEELEKQQSTAKSKRQHQKTSLSVSFQDECIQTDPLSETESESGIARYTSLSDVKMDITGVSSFSKISDLCSDTKSPVPRVDSLTEDQEEETEEQKLLSKKGEDFRLALSSYLPNSSESEDDSDNSSQELEGMHPRQHETSHSDTGESEYDSDDFESDFESRGSKTETSVTGQDFGENLVKSEMDSMLKPDSEKSESVELSEGSSQMVKFEDTKKANEEERKTNDGKKGEGEEKDNSDDQNGQDEVAIIEPKPEISRSVDQAHLDSAASAEHPEGNDETEYHSETLVERTAAKILLKQQEVCAVLIIWMVNCKYFR